MIKDIVMPQIGESLTEEIVIVKWRRKVGDIVKKGEIIVEIETGKGTVELESVYEGTLVEIVVREGQAALPLIAIGRIEQK